jgi:hypothetical protein
MWKTARNDSSDAAKLYVLTLCTGEGARFRALPKKMIMTKFATLEFLIFNFLSAIYCIATIEAVLSATSNPPKFFRELIRLRRSRRSVARLKFLHIQLQ